MAALVIEIFKEDEKVIVREGISSATQKPWKMQSQACYVHLGGKFPVLTSVSISEGETFYPAGKYEFDATSFEVGDFGRLGFSRDVLLMPIGKSF